jgi:hypothetical protein
MSRSVGHGGRSKALLDADGCRQRDEVEKGPPPASVQALQAVDSQPGLDRRSSLAPLPGHRTVRDICLRIGGRRPWQPVVADLAHLWSPDRHSPAICGARRHPQHRRRRQYAAVWFVGSCQHADIITSIRRTGALGQRRHRIGLFSELKGTRCATCRLHATGTGSPSPIA